MVHCTVATAPPCECIRQIVSAVVWYVWQEAIFSVPLSTLQRRKEDGGWNMMEMEIKYRALLLIRICLQGQREGTMRKAGWLKYWKLQKRGDNPQYKTIPISINYLRTYVQEIAYI